MVRCIQEHVDYLGTALNLFIELLISGRGRYTPLLVMVEGELEKLWGTLC